MNLALASAIAETEALAGFCTLLGRCPSASARKRLVMAARTEEALSDAETELVIGALLLEAA